MFQLLLVLFYAMSVSGNPRGIIGPFSIGIKAVTQCGWGGKAPLTTRIIKGSYAYAHEFPFAIYLTLAGSLYCGGTIVSDRYVVTAAHCVYGFDIHRIQIVAGASNVERDKSYFYDVDKAIIHDHYLRHENHDDQDIALLKTVQRIEFGPAITAVCLPSKTDYTRRTTVILGWGRTEQNKISPVLLKSYVKLMDSELCLKSFYTKDMKKVENICAYGLGTDTCQGDSGGGLIYEVEPYRYELVGIVSWGIGCASALHIPGVYVNVSHYIPWIRRKTADSVLLPYI